MWCLALRKAHKLKMLRDRRRVRMRSGREASSRGWQALALNELLRHGILLYFFALILIKILVNEFILM